MRSKRRPEPTLPKNPRQLTVRQHIHSRACICRFSDNGGRVEVLLPSQKLPFKASPDNEVFLAHRVWDEHLERGSLVRGAEDRFQFEVASVLKTSTVSDHHAVSTYLSIWQIRAELAANPPSDVVLHGVSSSLTKEQEEIVEKKHAAFVREDGVVPGRFTAQIDAVRRHDLNMRSLAPVRWGVVQTNGPIGFVCPTVPRNEAYIPVTRTVALIARQQDALVGAHVVQELNESLLGTDRVVFGYPGDVAALVGRARGRSTG